MPEFADATALGAGQSPISHSLILGVCSNRNNLPQVPCLPRSGVCA